MIRKMTEEMMSSVTRANAYLNAMEVGTLLPDISLKDAAEFMDFSQSQVSKTRKKLMQTKRIYKKKNQFYVKDATPLTGEECFPKWFKTTEKQKLVPMLKEGEQITLQEEVIKKEPMIMVQMTPRALALFLEEMPDCVLTIS